MLKPAPLRSTSSSSFAAVAPSINPRATQSSRSRFNLPLYIPATPSKSGGNLERWRRKDKREPEPSLGVPDAHAKTACLPCLFCTAQTRKSHLYSSSTERRNFWRFFFDPLTPPPKAGSIDQRHSSSQSLVCKNDAHRTSSPGERYFFVLMSPRPNSSPAQGRFMPVCRAMSCSVQTLKKSPINKALNRLICVGCIGALPHYVFNDFAMQHIFSSTNSKGPTDGSNH